MTAARCGARLPIEYADLICGLPAGHNGFHECTRGDGSVTGWSTTASRGGVVMDPGEEARDLDTAYDLIMAADDDNQLWESIATALREARNEGRCNPAAEEAS